jgi:hypothetical protein
MSHLLPCVFHDGARQRKKIAVCFMARRTAKAGHCRAFYATTHGKGWALPCVFLAVHGKGHNAPFGAGAVSCFSLPCASP